MKIVYEDNHVLVAVKPPGLLTQIAESENESLEAEVQAYLKERDKKPGNVFCYPIHRLDRPVRGLVLFAKSSKALSRLNASMREGKILKRYRAEIEGTLPKKEGILEHTLLKKHQKSVVSPEGKVAKLSYRVLEDGSVDITLHTGRYHQIRAQLAAMGCPIIGDEKYGASHSETDGINLCHYFLSFPHPVTKEVIECEESY